MIAWAICYKPDNGGPLATILSRIYETREEAELDRKKSFEGLPYDDVHAFPIRKVSIEILEETENDQT